MGYPEPQVWMASGTIQLKYTVFPCPREVGPPGWHRWEPIMSVRGCPEGATEQKKASGRETTGFDMES